MADEYVVGKTKLKIERSDIVKAGTEAIVNAANSALAGGGGVDGAIHTAAGRELYELTRPFGGCPTGSAVITASGRIPLPTRYIIHAVGPIYDEYSAGESERLLASAYLKSLELAEENQLKSVAFPSISTGVYGYPIQRAAPLVLRTVKEYLEKKGGNTTLELVLFVLYGERDLEIYRNALAKL
ncbi:MAG: macro domain-containing protein [Chloroflexi bacterium]|uniref:Macro domain-containing protein n=1 Tax=Candidatus Chlorohelix allophototropha TaxID=3003348 RepID=A0A8T7LRP1_9CHLR|nr:macro domain-containing protein [Chloroflexota bacterium]WJW66582.1 macro domain-containing protein [Chloroflexota bacterium L227-S17]